MAPTTMKEEADNQVTFMSWNSTGFNTVKSKWLTDVCNEKNLDFCSIQEHFKTSGKVINSFVVILRILADM